MCKILIYFLVFSVSSFALTLDQVRADLKKNSISGDSIEINVRTSVSTAGSKQSVSVFFVQKGKKIYSEINTSFLNQRSIVNDSRMKIIDLNTNKFQMIPYNGEPLNVASYTHFMQRLPLIATNGSDFASQEHLIQIQNSKRSGDGGKTSCIINYMP